MTTQPVSLQQNNLATTHLLHTQQDLVAPPEYTYLVTDLKSNRIVAELPLRSVGYSSKLSGAGSASASLSMNWVGMKKLGVRDASTPGRTGLYILRDGQCVWGGIIWKRSYSSTDANVRFECETFESYFGHRFQNEVKGFEKVDQMRIAYEYAIEVAAEIGITVTEAPPSGVTRYDVAFPYEFKTVLSQIDGIASLFNGFDWNVRVGIEDITGDFTRQIVWGYPNLGIDMASSSLMFEHPGNIRSYGVTEDADKSGTIVYSIGGGEGLDQLVSTAKDTNLLNSGFPVLEQSVSYKDVFSQGLLDDKVMQDMRKLRSPVTLLTLEVAADVDPVLGSYSPGDWARFRITDDWNEHTMDVMSRIITITAAVSDTGEREKVTLEIDQTSELNQTDVADLISADPLGVNPGPLDI